MGWTDLLLRLRALVYRRRAERELNEELNFHIEMEARKSKLEGIGEAEAQQSARSRFGEVDRVMEQCREVRGLTLLESLARDFRFGVRLLWKTPAFTAIAVLSLAIGIGANTGVFTLIDTVLLRMLPVRNPEQLVIARWGVPRNLNLNSAWATGGGDGHGGRTTNVFSWTIFSEMRARSRTPGVWMGFSPLGRVNVAANGRAISAGAVVVSGNYFQTLGAGTILGRPIGDDDDRTQGLPSAVISYRFWDRIFALSPTAIGKTLSVNGEPCIVIGITPRRFFGVSAGGFLGTPEVDVTLPIRARSQMEGAELRRSPWFGDDLFWVQVMGRLNDKNEEASAKNELAAIVGANLPETSKRDLASESPRIYLDPGAQGLDTLRQSYEQPLFILMTVVGLTLLMACANLAGLLLARASARQREMMLRLAVGASRGRLVRQLLIEAAVLSTIGATAGLAFAYWGLRALLTLAPSGSAPIPVEVLPDARVLGFTGAVSLLTTFLFALAPAIRATRVDVANGLKEDPAQGMRHFGAGRMLLALQVAIALVLLASSTLFTTSLINLRSLPLGFDPHRVVLFDLAPGKNGYDERHGNQLYARVLERLKQTRGVIGASLSAQRLISGLMSNGSVLVEGSARQKGSPSTFNFVGPDFFEVMGIPVIFGRGIALRDLSSTSRVAVINETVAREYFGGGSPLGRRFRWSSKKEWDVEVIGVVKDAKYTRLRGKAPPTIYAPYTQRPFGWPQEMSFEVRIAGNATEAADAIGRAVAEIDSTLPLTGIKTQEGQIDESLARERLFAWLVSLFSAITLALTCVGLYGSVAYAVTRRTREFGVRMALGANPAVVMRMLLGQVAVTVGLGLALGLPLTWALTRMVESQLFGVKSHDPISLTGACAAVLATAVLAAFLPARRAMRIDPARALRIE